MSTYVSLLMSGGQASGPQAERGSVPAEFSTTSENPSPSESGRGVAVAVAVAVGVGVGVAVGVAVGVGVGVAPDSGNPGTQTGPLVAVPLMPLPDESATEVPEPSFMPQRPIRPGADDTSTSFVAWIWAWLRAKFQMRASSRTPSKKPAATPVESKAVAKPACWMLSKRGVGLPDRASCVSRLPSR